MEGSTESICETFSLSSGHSSTQSSGLYPLMLKRPGEVVTKQFYIVITKLPVIHYQKAM